MTQRLQTSRAIFPEPQRWCLSTSFSCFVTRLAHIVSNSFNRGGQQNTKPAILVLVIASKELQTTTSGLSAKQSLLKHSYTLRGRAGCFCEVKPALLYRLKGIYKEWSVRRWGAIMGEWQGIIIWLTVLSYVTSSLLCMPLPLICWEKPGQGCVGKTTCSSYYSDGIMSLDLL